MSSSAPTPLPAYKADFLSSCVSAGVLTFGSFELKSKRVSPYFFNAGLFHRADLLKSISTAYACTLHAYASSCGENVEFDVLFGPAYKGIPLATATVGKLAEIDQEKYGGLSYSFNRKEAKTHGEGGSIVGAPLKGKRIVIVDDVITAGTAIREAISIIEREGGVLGGIIVAMDRQERSPDSTDESEEQGRSAIGEVRRTYGVPVLSILTLDEVILGLKRLATGDEIRRMEQYRAQYGATT